MGLRERYSSDAAQQTYDAIVIGSGMGGLTCAALLAKTGKRVLVLEKHTKAGGFTHIFKRKQYQWDVGVHYIGQVHKKHGILRRIFDDISDHTIDWVRMPEIYDRLVFGDTTYELHAGKQRFISKMVEYFPEERSAIEEYLETVCQVAKLAGPFYASKALPPVLAAVIARKPRKRFLKFANQTTRQVLEQITRNQQLISVLTGQYGDYGLVPAESSFAVHAMVVQHYLDGANYPRGGSQEIAAGIIPVIESAGGKVLVRADVESIITHKNRAVGVRMANGDELLVPLVISSVGFFNTFERLLKNNDTSGRYARKLRKIVAPSMSHLCLYAGIDKSPEELGIECSNYWIYPDYNHEKNLRDFINDAEADFPVLYVSFPSAKAGQQDGVEPCNTTLEVITPANSQWFMPWQDSAYKKRPAAYEELKEQMRQRMLERLEHHLPQLRDQITYSELSTPLTTQHFANYPTGEIYGLSHTPARFAHKGLRPHTPFKGLFLTGQDIVTAGVGGALMAGLITASAIQRRNLVPDILKRTSI